MGLREQYRTMTAAESVQWMFILFNRYPIWDATDKPIDQWIDYAPNPSEYKEND